MAETTISKTDFINYLLCPAYAWIAKYRKDLLPEEDPDKRNRTIAQSNEVERYAVMRYPGIRTVQSFGERGAEVSRQMIAEEVPAIYQPTVISPEGYMAKADILVRDGDGWAIHEVKSSNGLRTKDIPDMAFQKLAFERAGVPITHVVLVHLNRDYVRRGELDPQQLLSTTNADEVVEKSAKKTGKTAQKAVEYLRNPTEPTTCECNRRRHNHCPIFSHFHPDVPEYSIFNVSGLGLKILKDLVSQKKFEVTDIPDGVKLTDKGRQHVLVAKEGRPIIKQDSIKKILDSLKFPLYFLDYETTTGAFPLFDGCRPYSKMPFQYSLHVLDRPDAKVKHFEYLAGPDTKTPVQELCQSLSDVIGPQGHIVVWNKDFEMGCNDEMGRMNPAANEFLCNLNDRIFDLAEVFYDYHYLHPDFQGSWSIKKVLPVLVPELSYDGLEVQEGSSASALWEDAVQGKVPSGRLATLDRDLREYCELDTLAMVRVYQHLVEICRNSPS